jgi:hypothetical protein
MSGTTDVTKQHWVGVRLTPADKDKLDRLCAHARRHPSDLVRVLIRLAEPLDMPAVPVALPTGSAWEKTCETCVGGP